MYYSAEHLFFDEKYILKESNSTAGEYLVLKATSLDTKDGRTLWVKNEIIRFACLKNVTLLPKKIIKFYRLFK